MSFVNWLRGVKAKVDIEPVSDGNVILQDNGDGTADLFVDQGNQRLHVIDSTQTSGGHTIWNAIKTALTQRTKLWFADAKVTDDSTEQATKVEVVQLIDDESELTNAPDGLYQGDYDEMAEGILDASVVAYGEGTVEDALDELIEGGGSYTPGDGINIDANDEISVDTAFTEASTRTNIASGDSLATIWGKIKKFFTDLKTVAFTGSYTDLSDQPTIPTNTNQLTNGAGFITSSGTAANVSGTVAIGHGGTGATTRLGALQALTSEDVGTSAQYFLTITNSWGKGGYTSVANAKTVLGLGSAAYLTADTAASNNTVVRRNANGYIYAVYYNSSDSAVNINSYTAYVEFKDSSGWHRCTSLANFKTWFGKANSAASADSAGSATSASKLLWSNGVQLCGPNGYNAELRSAANRHLLAQDDGNLVWYGPNNNVIWQAGNSSRQFKHNIQDMTEERAKKILNIRAVTFDWNDGQPISTQKCDNAGVIAEEVSQIYPDLVVYDNYDNDPNTKIERRVEYERFTPYLIKMVQIQQKQIDTMQATINALEHRLSILEAK